MGRTCANRRDGLHEREDKIDISTIGGTSILKRVV